MDKEVQLPVSMDWSKEEVIEVIHFFEAIDKAHTKGIKRSVLLNHYQQYKKVVPLKSEEKQHFKDYQEQTGQSPYHIIKFARENDDVKVVKIK